MGAFISRQPNGLLCRFSSVVDCITHYNLTEEEYIEMCAERAREEARETIEQYLEPFERVLNETRIGNIKKEDWERIKKEMSEEQKRED